TFHCLHSSTERLGCKDEKISAPITSGSRARILFCSRRRTQRFAPSSLVSCKFRPSESRRLLRLSVSGEGVWSFAKLSGSHCYVGGQPEVCGVLPPQVRIALRSALSLL